MKCTDIAFSNTDKNLQCQDPVISVEKNQKVTDDESINPAKEKMCDFKYYFPSNKEPNRGDGMYDNDAAFATALLGVAHPTIQFYSGRNCKEHPVSFTDIFLVQFPLGTVKYLLKDK